MALNNSKEKIVTDNLDKIKEWLSQGVTMKAIADNLHISKQTLYKYLNLDGLDTIKNSRQAAVEKLENSMFISALGSKEIVKKHAKVKRIEYENGKKLRELEEIVEFEEMEYIPPDTTAAIFLLKNWGKYANEPVTNDLRKRELKLKEKQAENTMW